MCIRDRPQPFLLPPHLLGQGHQSTIGWIADLLGHAFLDAGGDVDLETLEGIVLLDALDLHMHHTWQRRLVPILRRVFPKLQFVLTTHSSLVLSGFGPEEIIDLQLDHGAVVQRMDMEHSDRMTGEQPRDAQHSAP